MAVRVSGQNDDAAQKATAHEKAAERVGGTTGRVTAQPKLPKTILARADDGDVMRMGGRMGGACGAHGRRGYKREKATRRAHRASIAPWDVREWSVRGAGYTSTGNASTTRNATSAPTTAPTARKL